jgi:hypothetical protein
MRYHGFLQHHPTSSGLAFLHRSGRWSKYDPNTDAGRAVTHMVLQPTCTWNEKWFRFEEFSSWAGKRIYVPADCAYDLHDAEAMRIACGVKYNMSGIDKDEVPPAFLLPEGSYLQHAQLEADAAFAALRRDRRNNSRLFTAPPEP